MRILNASVENFGSYKAVALEFDELGLCLITGATGSGKSTLQDIAPWVLFGVTAKNGNADEVKAWNAEGKTKGNVTLTLNSGMDIEVVRIRGTAKENDLFYILDGEAVRGKDLKDTQKLLNALLGVDSETFCMISGLNEFSETNQFFTTTTKNRRQLFEKLVDLSYTTQLVEKIKEQHKICTKYNDEAATTLQSIQTDLNNQEELTTLRIKDSLEWDNNHSDRLQYWDRKEKNFDLETKSKLDAFLLKSSEYEENRKIAIDKHLDYIEQINNQKKPLDHYDVQLMKLEHSTRNCKECGQSLSINNIEALKAEKQLNRTLIERCQEYTLRLVDLQERENPYAFSISEIKRAINTYSEDLKREQQNKNPFTEELDSLRIKTDSIRYQRCVVQTSINITVKKLKGLSILEGLLVELRGFLLQSTVKSLESDINSTLRTVFDSDTTVMLKLEDADKLDVLVTKNGHPAVFTQLSKGQRQTLKLCFAVSAMKHASNASGTSINTLFFDEAIEGLDSNLKLRSYDLFQNLAKTHECVLVIDHALELQPLFPKTIQVTLESDKSCLNES